MTIHVEVKTVVAKAMHKEIMEINKEMVNYSKGLINVIECYNQVKSIIGVYVDSVDSVD